MREHGLTEWIELFRSLAPVAGDTVLILEIHAGRWDLYGKTVVVSHEGDSNTYRWSADADKLQLAWVDTTYGDYEGIPERFSARPLHDRGIQSEELSSK